MNNTLIKWTGSKRYLSKTIVDIFPFNYNNYLEPFLGGGHILYCVDNKIRFGNDINSDLISIYELVKTDPIYLISHYEENWNRIQGGKEGEDDLPF